MKRIIDADTHLMEPPDIYVEHIDPKRRDLALLVEHDDQGWPWLTHRGRRLTRLDSHTPGRPDLIGEQQRRYAAGEPWTPAEHTILDPWRPAERIETLGRNGVDASIAFPNLGLAWEHQLHDDARPAIRIHDNGAVVGHQACPSRLRTSTDRGRPPLRGVLRPCR